MVIAIAINFAFSFLLLFQCYQVYKYFKYESFLALTFAFSINTCYLGYRLAYMYTDLVVIIPVIVIFLNLLSSFYFASVNSKFVNIKGKSRFAYHFIVWVFFLIIAFSLTFLTSEVSETLLILLSVFAVSMLLAFILKLRKKKDFKGKISKVLIFPHVGIIIYLAIHVISLIPIINSSIINEISALKVGHIGGSFAKLSMVVGFFLMHIEISKAKVEKGVFAEQLSSIIGLLFHELGPVVLSLEDKLEKLTHNQEKFKLNKSTQSEAEKIDFDINRLAAIYSSSYDKYVNRTDDNLLNDEVGELKQDLSEIFDSIDIDPQKLERLKQKKKVFNINNVIESAYQDFKRAKFAIKDTDLKYNESVDFLFEYGKNCTIRGLETRLAQVFLNLFKNSFEAFPNGEGKIFVKTKLTRQQDKNGFERNLVVAEIEDNGHGISKKDAPNIFDKKFSTKGVSYNLKGYGLTEAKNIVVKEMGGLISFESPIIAPHMKGFSNGTKFILHFLYVEVKNKKKK
ncbi:MAG: ATP-binding protein [Bacteroidota bacterium]